jgi:hypothetical protein
MPFVSHARKEIHLKVVYYGPGLGGKTTNLEYIHRNTRPDYRGKLISLETESERTLFFDLLPMELGTFRGYRVRMHLCTVPGQIARDATRRLVLRNVDGVVFVVDSQRGREESNLASMRNLDQNLNLVGEDMGQIPFVVQYNKRDLDTALPLDELRERLSIPKDVPEIEASALFGQGVFETLKAAIKLCLRVLGDPVIVPEGRSASILPGKRISAIPEAEPPAARDPVEEQSGELDREVSGVKVPLAPAVPRVEEEDG